MNSLPLYVARQQPGGAVIDRVDGRGIGEDGDDRLGVLRQVRRRRGDRRAGVGRPASACRSSDSTP